MKRLFVLAALFFFGTLAASAQPRSYVEAEGFHVLGAVGLGTESPNVRAGVAFPIAGPWRLSATVNNYFVDDGGFSDLSWLSVEADAHYLLDLLNNDQFTFYGLGGVGLHRFTYEFQAFGQEFDDSETVLGLNFGVGVQANLADDRLKPFGDVKYQAIFGEIGESDAGFSQLMLSVGIMYRLSGGRR